MDFGKVKIAREKAEKARVQRERDRASWASKDARRRAEGKTHDEKRLFYKEYPFVMWDGEAPKDTGYSLFGSSSGYEICNPSLTTEQCFDLLLEARKDNPETINVIFGGRYDFDEILRLSIPWNRLARIKKSNTLRWHGYRIEEIDGKYLKIAKDGTSVTLWDCSGWFKCAYVKALTDYGIGSKKERAAIQKEKERRSEFTWAEIEGVRKYMHLELKLGPPLMERIREICIQAGFNPHSWYGPSALAREALRTNHIDNYIGNIPYYVNNAAQYAFAGGRFEDFRGGILEKICSADQNSAYMAAALELPDLANGEWRRGCEFEPGKFAVYHIRYAKRIDPSDPIRLYPLFHRNKLGNVTWPNRTEGWYWSPEAELVKDDPDAEFLEAYIFDERSNVRPFTFVREWYRKRLYLKNLPLGNPNRKAEKAFKWALASIYGQLARTVGWDKKNRKPPGYHCLEWAGYITSRCRAEMYKAAKACGTDLVSIDTDSVTARCPIYVPESEQLGDWKIENYDRGVFFQSGVFALEKDGEWVERKARGIEERRGRLPVSPEMMISAIYDGGEIKLPDRPRYVSIRMGLQHRFKDAGKWITPPDNKLHFGGSKGGSKRYHRNGTCYRNKGGALKCESQESHIFVPRPIGSPADMQLTKLELKEKMHNKSEPHYLPWKGPKENPYPDAKFIVDSLFFNPETMDPEEDKWLATLTE